MSLTRKNVYVRWDSDIIVNNNDFANSVSPTDVAGIKGAQINSVYPWLCVLF